MKHATTHPLGLERLPLTLRPDSRRVLLRSFNPTNDQRSRQIIARIAALSEARVHTELRQVIARFEDRHRDVKSFWQRRFAQISVFALTDIPLSPERQLLIGAYFTQEYALEGAALFNPSLVWHPDQSGLAAGQRRFIVSLRATGEGHLSSIAFRSGTVDTENQLTLDPASRLVTGPETLSYPVYERALFERKLHELGHSDSRMESVLALLGSEFTLDALKQSIQVVEQQQPNYVGAGTLPLASLLTLARANYTVDFAADTPLAERVLFPTSPTEINGIEDARFVMFRDDCGELLYYATYTAYDGKNIMPQLLKTTDFRHFEMSTLNGPEVQNKGMALFPRKIHGRYAMLGRQDNESIYLMFSDNLHFWYSKEILLKPTFPWEYVQLGNCGSPLETDAGWLVLTHGVGAMRQYAIGAILLDRDDPSRVLGRLRVPLLLPETEERDGYVPNVVYSCGAQLHQDALILPYAMSDTATRFAVVSLDSILRAM